MKLTEIKNEDALDVLVDLIDPFTEIVQDGNFVKLVNDKEADKVALIKTAIKNHKSAIIKILATLSGVPVEEYQGTPITIMRDALAIFADEDLLEFFTSQGQIETYVE